MTVQIHKEGMGVYLDWETASRITLADLMDQYRLVQENIQAFKDRIESGEELPNVCKMDMADAEAIVIHLAKVIKYYGGTVE